jgi:hypothetical protein
MQFSFVTDIAKYLNFPQFQMIYQQSVNYDSLLHFGGETYMRVCPNVSGLAAWSENCKWYGSLPLAAAVSLFCESV